MLEGSTRDLARIHIQVQGHVQGVGFRAFVQQAGVTFGLTGWVRNVGYDQVELVAEGPRHLLEKFSEIIKKGPHAGRVDEAHEEWEPALGEFHAFTIKHSL